MADAMSITRRRFLKVAPAAAIATPVLVSGADAAPKSNLDDAILFLAQTAERELNEAAALGVFNSVGQVHWVVAMRCLIGMAALPAMSAETVAAKETMASWSVTTASGDRYVIGREIAHQLLASIAEDRTRLEGKTA